MNCLNQKQELSSRKRHAPVEKVIFQFSIKLDQHGSDGTWLMRKGFLYNCRSGVNTSCRYLHHATLNYMNGTQAFWLAKAEPHTESPSSLTKVAHVVMWINCLSVENCFVICLIQWFCCCIYTIFLHAYDVVIKMQILLTFKMYFI